MILEDVDAAPPDVVRSLTVTNTQCVLTRDSIRDKSVQGNVHSSVRGRCDHYWAVEVGNTVTSSSTYIHMDAQWLHTVSQYMAVLVGK